MSIFLSSWSWTYTGKLHLPSSPWKSAVSLRPKELPLDHSSYKYNHNNHKIWPLLSSTVGVVISSVLKQSNNETGYMHLTSFFDFNHCSSGDHPNPILVINFSHWAMSQKATQLPSLPFGLHCRYAKNRPVVLSAENPKAFLFWACPISLPLKTLYHLV